MGSEISKKDITRLGFRSSLLQASFNYERMQAGGFTNFDGRKRRKPRHH